jgi:hypothetical protein
VVFSVIAALRRRPAPVAGPANFIQYMKAKKDLKIPFKSNENK